MKSVMLTSLALGVGLVVGGCAAPTDEEAVDSTASAQMIYGPEGQQQPGQVPYGGMQQPGQVPYGGMQQPGLLQPGQMDPYGGQEGLPPEEEVTEEPGQENVQVPEEGEATTEAEGGDPADAQWGFRGGFGGFRGGFGGFRGGFGGFRGGWGGWGRPIGWGGWGGGWGRPIGWGGWGGGWGVPIGWGGGWGFSQGCSSINGFVQCW